MPSQSWNRREFNRSALLAALSSTLGACGDGEAVDEPRPTPKGVVLITADDLGWRDLSAYGLANVATPNLDRLVNEGIAFSKAFDVVSSCSSSRATIVTGQYPHTHGVTGLVHRHPELSLPCDHPTIVRAMGEAGFETAVQGKWHLSADAWPEDFGYGAYLQTDIDQRIRSVVMARAFLENFTRGPFYLELNYMQTHRDLFGDFVQAEGYEVSTDDAAPPEWWGLPDWPEIREEVAGYLSHLRWMDALVGEVLDELDTRGLADDTLVVFISDNGPAFPGCKTTVYDRGLGTPLMFRWPAVLEPRWSDELVSSVDVAPTVLDLLGLPAMPSVQGRSLAPHLLQDPSWVPATHIFAEMERHSGDPKPARSVRTHGYKYIRNLTDEPWGSGGGDGAWKDALALEPDQFFDDPRPPEELFDLEADPTEKVNAIDDPALADVLDELRAALDAHLVATDDFRAGE